MTNIKRKDDVLILLVRLGYLAYDSVNKSVYIQNDEVRHECISVVATGRHKEVAKLIQYSDRLIKATLAYG